MKKKNIYLIGFMGTGKTSVSKELAESLGRPVIELDYEIEKECGRSIQQLFEESGEQSFRDLESQVLLKAGYNTKAIISCGGGVVLNYHNVERMKQNGWIVRLTACPETVFERIRESSERPLFNQNPTIEAIRTLMGERETAYQRAADVTVPTDGQSLEQISWEILTKLNTVME